VSEEENKEVAKSELEIASINGIAYILTHLTDYYGGYIPDDIELNNVFIDVFAKLCGEMLAHYPEDLQDDVFSGLISKIQENMDLVSLELQAEDDVHAEDEATFGQIDDLVDRILKGTTGDSDLANMKPKGSC